MKIKKAVIPAAGFGTRMLPYTKAVPKEMLPIIDKPGLQYIVEEARDSGITDILIVLSRGKSIIEDHFDYSPELEEKLLSVGKENVIGELKTLIDDVNIYYIRQYEALGLGHAIMCSKSFVGNEPFAVLYGDDVIVSEKPVCRQLCDIYEETGKSVVGIKEVAYDEIHKYSSLSLNHIKNNIYSVIDMVEKPQTKDEVLDYYSIFGRCVLSPDVFEILEKLEPGSGGEIQLTDAMAVIAKERNQMLGVDFEGKRYDMGNKLGLLEANIEVGINHPEIGEDLKKYLKEFVKNLS